ncbi:MAG: dihydropteroate synthase [Desulfobacteraceae bacterium]|nr:dihydropteroate synthase [Desulfobacteraceae bacterium]
MKEFTLEWDRFKLELGKKPCIMGILNVTPDSFSDGGQYFNFEKAVAQGKKLVEKGADILDIGGESSRPFAEPVSETEEIERVVPVIRELSHRINIPISIDTVKSKVAKQALDAGASMINDISAFEKDPELADLAAKRNVPVIMMHMKGTPETMQVNPEYNDLIKEINDYFIQRVDYAVKKGIQKTNIILDPGIGFGKTVKHNLVILNNIDKIAALGFPVLIGSSRKSFIQKILNKKNKKMDKKEVDAASKECENGTLASVAAAFMNGGHIVRVHDVARVKPFVQILDSIKSA